MKISNLNPKDGAYFEIDEDGDLCLKTKDDKEVMLFKEYVAYVDFDTEYPLYKVGDRIKLHNFRDKKFLMGIVYEIYPNRDYGVVEVDNGSKRTFNAETFKASGSVLEIISLWEDDK